MKSALLSFVALTCSLVYADGTGTGLTGQYFNDAGSGGHLEGSPVSFEVDPTISFDFVVKPPAKLGTTNFSAKWTGQLEPRFSEQYLLMTYSDDGVRVYINSQLLIDNWTTHAGTWKWNWIRLNAGQLYEIEVDYFQGSGAAALQLWWQSASQAKEIVPQTQLYSGTSPTNPGTTYYVSPSGNDANTGLTVAQPWRSPSRVNTQSLHPGDRVLFQRGGRYQGSLEPEGSGSIGAPISLGAYGNGPLPVIDGTGYETAVKLFNQEFWNIDALDIIGSQRFGLWISGDLSNHVLHSFTLTNLHVHDIYSSPRWDSGLVMVAPIGDHLTFAGVTIDGVTADNTNLWYGIHVGFNLWYSYPKQPPQTTNVIIRNSTVHDVYGDGITVAQAQTVLIEKSLVYNTGLAPAGISYTPNGIWSWQSDQTVVQYNEGYATHSYGVDGGVFDVDWGSTNTTIQYNYAHDAQGYCVAVMGAHHVTTTNSIVRFNICSNNARSSAMASGQGDIFLTTFDGGSLNGVQIYNNATYWNPAAEGGWIHGRGLSLTGSSPDIMNNVVYSTARTMVDLDSSISLNNNLYWIAGSGMPVWKYGLVLASSLTALRATTGQEQNGMFADPQLNDANYTGVARPTSQFTLMTGSPAIGKGRAWAAMGPVDFFGNALPLSGTIDIGPEYLKP